MTLSIENEMSLNKRELQILNLLCNKITESEKIAEELFLSRNTVKSYLRSIYSKLDATDKTQAVIEALRQKIIVID